MSQLEISSFTDNSRLHLIIMPTEKCNFRCVYCYEEFTNGQMKSETIKGIKNLIQNRSETLSNLEIGWFGGEPLLGLRTVLEISSFAAELSAAQGFNFASSMSTNAYLLNTENFTNLVNAGVSVFQVSIDGEKIDHDQTRLVASGKGSFDRIWRNLLDAKRTSLSFEIALRIHLTNSNLSRMPNIAKKINEAFSEDSRFSVYIKPVENLGGDRVQSLGLVNKYESFRLSKEVEKLFNNEMLVKSHESTPPACYAAAANSLVIRSTGRIAKCTVLLSDEDNDLGYIDSNGKLIINNDRYGKWVSALFNPQTAFCPVNHVKSLNQPV